MRYSSYFVHFNTSGLANDVSDVGDTSTNTVVVAAAVTASTAAAVYAVVAVADDDDYKYRYKYLSKGERWTETVTLTRNIQ